jgi:predicted RNase H-like HicB family nuclease
VLFGASSVPIDEVREMETYLLVIGKTATGYSAHCPDVPGCASVGKTADEVVANMKKALELHFEGMAEDGDAIPKTGRS